MSNKQPSVTPAVDPSIQPSITGRLPEPFGLLIDRDKPLSFTFEGKTITAFEGDSIASALLADQQWLMSRSFKYHRPRGPLTLAGQDANTMVQLPSAPNTLADKQPAQDGQQVRGQNYVGSLNRDWQAYTGLLSRFLPVGFYYKTFFRPRGVWELWAKFFRRQAGLGVIDQSFQPEYFDKQYKFADVTVIGAGPAGLSAALAAAQAGVEVMLIDENPALGGSLNYARFAPDDAAVQQLREQLLSQVAAADNIEVMTEATVNSWHPDNWMAVVSGKRLYKLRSKQVIVAAGSLEQQAIFRGNDIPGVVMSSAAQRLMRLYAVKPAERAVVLTGNDEGYASALELVDAGVEVAAVVDMREAPQPTELTAAVVQAGIAVHHNSTVYEAFMHKQHKRLSAVEIRNIESQGVCGSPSELIECGLLSMAVGYMPTYQLVCQAGGQLSYADESCLFSLSNYPENFHLAGSVNGAWSLDAVTRDGQRAGTLAAACVVQPAPEPSGPVQVLAEREVVLDPLAATINFAWPMFPHPKGKEFVDFDEDLQIKDIINATLDGYEHIQLVKRYSTCGMGPSQGRHSALATARLVADATNRSVAETGVTTARPPFAAELLAHNAGRSFYPARRSNMHYRHIEAGAQMMQAGAWYRPAYYGDPANSQQTICDEVTNVRNNVGLVDVSTLGGLEVRGTQAAEFLNRFYTFTFTKQPVGRARYALLTNEAGVVIDDGVACRFHYDHFYVTATTGGVERVFQSMLKWNALWQLDVDIANVTTAWCGVNLAGPKSRDVLCKLCDSNELLAENFPYMGVKEVTVAGIAARVIRVGFVGELGFEIHVPQSQGEALWDALIEAGQEHGIKPFGVEAQRILRLEKGHIIIGQDTDAMSNPLEVQMGWAIARKKPFFVGARSIRDIAEYPQSRVLVGFTSKAKGKQIPKESHLVLDGKQMVGRVTSCSYSPTLKMAIGLAYVPISMAEPATQITIKVDGGKKITVTVVSLPFYDPANARQEL